MGIGIKTVFKDLGWEVEIQVKTDSSAARSISSRRGAKRVRHVEVHEGAGESLQGRVVN